MEILIQASQFLLSLSILIILNLRNGLSLVNISGNTQTGIIGLLLILSVLLPNWLASAQRWWGRGREAEGQTAVKPGA